MIEYDRKPEFLHNMYRTIGEAHTLQQAIRRRYQAACELADGNDAAGDLIGAIARSGEHIAAACELLEELTTEVQEILQAVYAAEGYSDML